MDEKTGGFIAECLKFFNNFFAIYETNKESLSTETKNFLFVGITVAVIAVFAAIGFSMWSSGVKPKENQNEKGIVCLQYKLVLATATQKKKLQPNTEFLHFLKNLHIKKICF